MTGVRFHTVGFTALALLAAPGHAKTGKSPFIALEYLPQQEIAAESVHPSRALLELPVAIELVDGRQVEDPTFIGKRSHDDDRLMNLQAGNDVITFVRETVQRIARGNGVKVVDSADMVLAGRLLRYEVNERNKPLGATYVAEVRILFDLRSRAGVVTWSGEGIGEASRFGKARSADNANEVLSDALLEAMASVLNSVNPGAPRNAPASAGSAGSAATTLTPRSPEDLLTSVRELMANNFSQQAVLDFIAQQSLTRAFEPSDMVNWKKALVPEDVMRAAMRRPVAGM